MILLNLSNKSNPNTKGRSFEKLFAATLAQAFGAAGAGWGDSDSWVLNFERALSRVPDSKLVLLIDDYDAPLTRVLHDQGEFEARREILEDFFSAVKLFADKFRFTFITGVAGMSDVGLSLGTNNITDISFDPDYGAIAGFTQEELEQNFKPFMADAARVLKEKEPQQGWDEPKVLKRLNRRYGGFSFDLFARKKVYNPGSVINFSSGPDEGFQNYWRENGGNTTLLMRYLNNLIEKGAEQGQRLSDLPDFLAPDFEKKIHKQRLY